MKQTTCNILPTLWLALACLFVGGCAKEYHLTVTVNADGSTDVHTRFTMDREQAEQLVMWNQRDLGHRNFYYGDEQGWEDVVEEGVVIPDEAPEATLDADPQSLTDEQIVQGFTELSRDQSPLKDIEGISQAMISVTVDEEFLHAEGQAHFDSLELFVEHGAYYWERAGIESFRIEQDDDGNIVAVATPGEMYTGGNLQVRRMLRSQKFKGSFRLVVPGTVLSCPLPNTEANQTWIEVDGEDDASLDQLFSVMDEPLRVTAEPGGLDLSALPLDSTELAEQMEYGGHDEPDTFADLEIIEGPDGYYAEPTTLVTSMLILLPGAEEKLGQRIEYLRSDFDNTATISAKLYAPEGQRLLAISKVQTDKAVDDMGETVGLGPRSDYGGYRMRGYGMFSDDEEEANNSADFQVVLSLPQPDAQAIEEVSGKLIVVAFDNWATHKVERVRANPGRVIDLSDILPGASLTVKRYKRHFEPMGTDGRIEGRLELEMRGPESVSVLQLGVELPGSDHVSSHDSMDETQTKDGVTTRTLMLQYNVWNRSQLDADAVTLTIRFPQGVRREEVPFHLEAMDMY
jgi:hypothetical protein